MQSSFIRTPTRKLLVGLALAAGAILAFTSTACTVTVSCGPGLTDCGGICVDLNSNQDYCGTCGTICPAADTCVQGQCTAVGTCGGGLTYCAPYCVDLSSDPNYCGDCNTICGAGDICVQGQCVVGVCYTPGSGCQYDGDCCTNYCVGGTCACIASGSYGCNADSDCCSNFCDLGSGVCQ